MGNFVETIALKAKLATHEAADESVDAIVLMNHKGGKLEDLETVLRLSDDYQYDSAVAISWLDNEERTTEDFQAALALSDNTEYKSAIAQSWLSKEGREAKDFGVALPSVNDEQLQSAIALSWVGKEGRTSDDLQTVLPFVADEEARSEIAVSWLNKGGRTPKDLEVVLPLVTDQEMQSDIAADWFKKEVRTPEDFQTVWPLFADEEDQSRIAALFLKNEGRTSEDLQAALPLVTNKEVQSYFAESWSKKKGRTMEDVLTILPLVAEKSTQFEIAESWINREQNPQTKYDNFTDFAKAGVFNDKYNTLKITYAYLTLSLPADKLPSLGADLYPNNESMQVALFKECMRGVDDDYLVDIKPQLKSFIQNLKGDESALEAITAVRDRIELPPTEILEITKNRLSNKYESLSDVLNGKSLEDSLSKEGLQSVRKLFSNDTSPIDIKPADLLSYYDVQNGLADFKSLLMPEVLQEVVEKFSPPSKTAYISDEEYKKMSQLLNNEATPESNITLPSVKIIADYLSSKVGDDINKVFTPEEITTYQFGNSTTLQNEEIPNRREYLTEKFRNLLEAKDPTSEEVSEFFERALNPEVANPEIEITARNGIINEENKGKLTAFFDNSKHMLASLFQQEGGLDDFTATITSLGHGCVANIITQARVALYQSLITDPNDQALFGVFKEKISGEILNSGGDLLMGGEQGGADVFNDHNINKNFVSPNGLQAAISEEFYSNGKIKRNAVEFVKEEAGEDVRDELSDSILDLDPDTYNQEMAKIAAYMILQKTLPDLCENKYLAKPREEYLAIIEAGKKQEVVSEKFDDKAKTHNATDASYQSVTNEHEVNDAVKSQVGDVLKALKHAHVNEFKEEEKKSESHVDQYNHHHAEGGDKVTTH